MQEREIRYEEALLVEGCLAGESRAQEKLYQKYARRMFAVCCRYAKDDDTAADILQDGFIRIFHALPSFRKEGSLEGWIRRIMVNTALEYHRKNAGVHLVYDSEEKDHVPSDADTSGNLDAEELLKLVQALPSGYRTVFNLYAIEGYSHKEIADLLGISEGTSKSQLARARSMLQLKLVALMEVPEQ